MKNNITISTDLVIAMNHLCTHTELKILLAALCHENCDLSFVQIKNTTGITQSNNYFRVRKQLLLREYLLVDEFGLYVNAGVILNDYKNMMQHS